MSASYTKLFSSIITSTIWMEDDATRIVWITMLALADRNGEVQGSVPGLARLAGVTVDACDIALGRFMAPDPRSRTKDEEGRRIAEIDGGWLLLNHGKYRRMASLAEKKEADAIRQRRVRERRKDRHEDSHAQSRTVTDPSRTSHAPVTSQFDIAEAEEDSESGAPPKGRPPDSDSEIHKPSPVAAREDGPAGAGAHAVKSLMTVIANRKRVQ